MILTPLQKLPNNVGDLGKIIVAASFECLPKVQKIATSGHTAVWLNNSVIALVLKKFQVEPTATPTERFFQNLMIIKTFFIQPVFRKW